MKADKHIESTQPMPIWLAALRAAQCRATGGSRRHVVPWARVLDRAVYTNTGDMAEFIEPLGVRLECGETLAVSWKPGETGYTMEVYGRSRMCA
jgi:hypothetical protein